MAAHKYIYICITNYLADIGLKVLQSGEHPAIARSTGSNVVYPTHVEATRRGFEIQSHSCMRDLRNFEESPLNDLESLNLLKGLHIRDYYKGFKG